MRSTFCRSYNRMNSVVAAGAVVNKDVPDNRFLEVFRKIY